MPEKHHLYTALQAKPSPGIQTYRDALFPARQTPREALGSSVSQSRSWSGAKQTLRASIAEGSTCSSCAPDGSRESVKCQVRQEACAPRWSNQLHALAEYIEMAVP